MALAHIHLPASSAARLAAGLTLTRHQILVQAVHRSHVLVVNAEALDLRVFNNARLPARLGQGNIIVLE